MQDGCIFTAENLYIFIITIPGQKFKHMPEKTIIFCTCQARQASAAWVAAGNMLHQRHDIRLVTLTDLCGWCVQEPGKVAGLVAESSGVLIVACYPRAVKLLLQKAGITLSDDIQCFNLLDQKPGDLLTRIDYFRLPMPKAASAREFIANTSWPAWYPVIDTDRCNACGQCADFCLFGTYRKADGKVEVVNPQGCKNNCPACARICPQVAIVFPKYAQGGAIGGSDAKDEALEMQRLKKDTDAILGSDIYQALEQRKMKRRMIVRDEAMQQALREREQSQGK